VSVPKNHRARSVISLAACRRKQRQITLQLDDLGMENLETQLHDATERPSEPRHRFATVIMVLIPDANVQPDL